jgi:hypothetical protein
MGTVLSLDLAVLPKEVKLLLLFMKRGSEGITLSCQEELLLDTDWDLFLELTRHHRVYPYIYNEVKKIDRNWIPSYVIRELRQEYQQNTFHMLRLSGEIEQVSKLLTDNEIHVLLLKGPALAADLYGDVSKRTCNDLDVLISINDLEKTHELLIELDYVKDDYFSTVLNDWRWRHHHVTYFHPHKKIKLEIHWRLNPGPSHEPTFHELWERKRLSTLTSSPVYMLGYEDLFIFLVSHGARHGWSRLRWLLDLDRIVSLHNGWEKLHTFLKRYQMDHVGGQALILSSELLGTPIPKELRTLTVGKRPKLLAQDTLFYIKQMIHLHREPLPDDVARYHKRHLFSLMSFQLKLLYVISFLYPYPMDVEILPLPRSLHFLYFPLRPFLWAWRKTRKRAWL